MEKTKLLYHFDTHNLATLAQVLEKGTDENGHYLIFDRTIYYPGGGGQPKDVAHISFKNGINHFFRVFTLIPYMSATSFKEYAFSLIFFVVSISFILYFPAKLKVKYYECGI